MPFNLAHFDDDQSRSLSYIKGLKNQDPQNRQAALALVLEWLNNKMGSIMNSYAKGDDANEKAATELEDMITYLAQGWSKGVLDFSEKDLPTINADVNGEGRTTPPSTPVQPQAQAQAAKAQSQAEALAQGQAGIIAQNTKMIKATYATKPKRIAYAVKEPDETRYPSKKKTAAYQNLQRQAIMAGKIKL